MEIFVRKNFLPDHEKTSLLKSVQTMYPKVKDMEVNGCFFIWLEDKLDELNKRYTQSLLCAKHIDAKHFWQASKDILIAPREGTKTQESFILQNITKKCKIPEIKTIMVAVQYRFILEHDEVLSDEQKKDIVKHMHDQSSHRILTNLSSLAGIFSYINEPHEAVPIDLNDLGIESLKSINAQLELGLSDATIKELFDLYTNEINRDPYDLEVITFFDAMSIQDRLEYLSKKNENYLDKLREEANNSSKIISALELHSAIYKRNQYKTYYRCLETGLYNVRELQSYTASFVRLHQDLDTCPFESGATSTSYAIAQASAVGSGSKPRAHIAVIAVGSIEKQAQEDVHMPMASAKQTLIDANMGNAHYANAVGIPLIAACFRAFSTRGYEVYNPGLDKPVILNKVLSEVYEKNHIDKSIQPGDELIILGCPVMNVGDVATKLAGGALNTSFDHEHHKGIDLLDITQVDMQNRAQNVINACAELEDNPISVVEALGEGGLTRALLYILKADKEQSYGFHIQLRNIHAIRKNFTATQLWGSEMQERYLIICPASKMQKLFHYADREQCPYTTIGRVTDAPRLQIYDDVFDTYYMDINHHYLTDNIIDHPTSIRQKATRYTTEDACIEDIEGGLVKLLMSDSLGSKKYLLREHDTYNGGLVVSGPFIGKKQMPIGGYGLIRSGFIGCEGEFAVVTERLTASCVDPMKAAKLAIADAFMRAAAVTLDMSDCALEFQWLCEQECPGAMQDLEKVINSTYTAIKENNIAQITETKISSKHSVKIDNKDASSFTSFMPASCIVNLTAAVTDVRCHKTAFLDKKHESAKVVWCNLTANKAVLGGSTFNRVHDKIGEKVPDIDLGKVAKWFSIANTWAENEEVYAYQPVGQGGLLLACAQLIIAGELGLDIKLEHKHGKQEELLFSEGVGAVLILSDNALAQLTAVLEQVGLKECMQIIGTTTAAKNLSLGINQQEVFKISQSLLHASWEHYGRILMQERGKTKHEILELQDSTLEYNNIPMQQQQWCAMDDKPKLGMLVEPGATGASNLAAAFTAVGFKVIEFSLADIINHHENLLSFTGLVIPNGHSYQEVGKTGRVVAMQILREPKLKTMFTDFFNSPYTFTLGVGDGAHILSELRVVIPTAENWPSLKENASFKVENRWVMSKITKQTKSIMLQGMHDSIIPMCIAHKNGQLYLRNPELLKYNKDYKKQIAMQYVDTAGQLAEAYPYNPNGSIEAIAGFCSADGRITGLIGLPERGFQVTQLPFNDPSCKEHGPWLRIFANARKWVEDNPQPPIRF